MINWYRDYDTLTFMKPFEKIDFRPYNPNHEIGQDIADSKTIFGSPEQRDTYRSGYDTIFDNSSACIQMLSQFRAFIKDQLSLRPLKDPFSELCIKYCRQSIEVVFLET